MAQQREQVEREHAQHEMQRVGSEFAAKLADAVLRILAPAVASVITAESLHRQRLVVRARYM